MQLSNLLEVFKNRIKDKIYQENKIIVPKRDWTHFLKIWLVVAGGGFYSYFNLQCIKLDKDKRIIEKKSFLCIQKTFNAVFKNGFNFTPPKIIAYK